MGESKSLSNAFVGAELLRKDVGYQVTVYFLKHASRQLSSVFHFNMENQRAKVFSSSCYKSRLCMLSYACLKHIVTHLQTQNHLPSTDIQLKRCIPMESFLDYYDYLRIILFALELK